MFNRQSVRFLIVGGANTAVTYGVYCVLVFWISAHAAWLIVYLLGMAIGYVGHSRLVFSSDLRFRRAAAYTLLQVSMFGLSSSIIYWVHTVLGHGPRVAAGAAILVSVPISFLVSRKIMRSRNSEAAVAGV